MGGPRFNYGGDWIGNRNLDLPGTDKYTALTLSQVTLNVKGNRFIRTEAGMVYGGSIDYTGDHIELHTDSFMDRPLKEQGADAEKMHPAIKVTPQKDGTLLFDDPRALDGKPVVLKRKGK